MDRLSTLTGVPGYLNGTLDAHAAGIASMTRDAHHGDTADYEFHPVLNTGIFFSTFMKYGKEKGKKCCDVTEEGIKSYILLYGLAPSSKLADNLYLHILGLGPIHGDKTAIVFKNR